MTTLSTSSTSLTRRSADRRVVDVFGVQWPRYKAEAVIVALVVLALAIVFSIAIGASSLSPAILLSAGSGLIVWWTARILNQR